MEIIKRGKIPEPKAEITCMYCDTIFAVTPEDAIRRYSNIYTFECPVCGNTNTTVMLTAAKESK